MQRPPRADDFATRRVHLRGLSDDQLHARFWELVERIVDPLIEEARGHTTPSIERSVLLRMGFSSIDAKALVDAMAQRRLLGHGAGRLVLELARAKGIGIDQAGAALLAGRLWEELPL
jgi:D-ornithine 4,5-aminomutase subunit alpha